VSILALGALPTTGNGAVDGSEHRQPPGAGISPATAIVRALEARFSDMGPDGDATYDARRPAVAYNSTDNEYLVVWEADGNDGNLVADEFEIRGQRIDAGSGTQVGADDFRVSFMGPDGDPAYGAFRPAVAYNSTANQYLVVWYGDDDSLGLADGEFEIYGQRLDAAGTAIGTAFRISTMGGDGSPTFFARNPEVVYNSASNEYLVVWEGEDNVGGLVAGEAEIFGQLIDASGQQIGPDDFRISDMGPNGHTGYDAFNPAAACNHAANQYLVVWEGDDNANGLVANEFEIFGQLIAATTGQQIGANDLRVSMTGANGAAQFDAAEPAAVYNAIDDEYLVVWHSDGPPLLDEKIEIRGQRIDAPTGSRVEIDDFVISSMGDPGDIASGAASPAVAYDANDNSYLVAWHGDDPDGNLVDNEFEIFARLVTFPLAGSQFRVSDMGTADGDSKFDARWAVAACNTAGNEFVVLWDGDDNTGPLVDDESEIYGQRLAAATTVETGANDFRISSAGGDGDHTYDAGSAAVAYNSINKEYLVVWEGDDDIEPLVDGELEIFGQRIDALTGAEIGANDFRISDMGPDGDPTYEGGEPQVAYNSINNLYLVVWEGDDNTPPFVNEEFEVHGQLIDGATGSEIGADFRISDVGPDGLNSRDAGTPYVAWDSIANRFLVVWEADDTDVGTPNHKNEIHGQLIDGATGAEVGPNDFRISDMGEQDDPEFDAREAAVAFNSVDHEFLVVWRGEDDTGDLVFDEFEIFCQRIDAATAAEVGLNDFRISDMGPDGNTNFNAHNPAVAYNSGIDQYLVVWRADNDLPGLADNEFEVYGQILDGATGAEIGVNDFRISDMGPDGDPLFSAKEPSVAYGVVDNGYLVAWEGVSDGKGLGAEKVEIFVQRIDANGSEVGENDIRASHTGTEGNAGADALDPGIAYGGGPNKFLVAWGADPAAGAMVDNENEIFGGLIDGVLCPDLDGDNMVGVTDFLALLEQWGTDPGGPPDLDGNGDVGINDFLELLTRWGPCP
jgi:hypothetical protein